MRLTFGQATDIRPLWTPQTQRIVFRSNRDLTKTNLYWKASDGTGQVERLTTSPRAQSPVSFSADGKQLVFTERDSQTGGDSGNSDLYVLSMEGERRVQPLLTESFSEDLPVVSPLMIFHLISGTAHSWLTSVRTLLYMPS